MPAESITIPLPETTPETTPEPPAGFTLTSVEVSVVFPLRQYRTLGEGQLAAAIADKAATALAGCLGVTAYAETADGESQFATAMLDDRKWSAWKPC